MSRWFRHYAGMMRDDKLVRVAVKVGQPVERVVWVWGAILESAAEINDGGRYDFDAAEAAYFLRASEDDIRAVTAGLEAAGRLGSGAVVKWGDRQFESDRSATRQAAYRERKRSGDGGNNARKASGDGVVTAVSRHGDAPETETETETETEKKDATANAVGAVAPLAQPPNETPEARLWRVGLPDLMALGLTEARARPLIGSWRRDTGDDCERVLGAIMRAREYAVANPAAWITASLKPSKTNGKTQTVQSAAAELVESVRSLRKPGIGGGTGATPVRVLSEG